MTRKWFFAGMAIACFAVAFFGFFPNSYAIISGQRENPHPIVHVHAAFMVAWLALLMAQSVLVALGRRSLHFQFGLAALVLAPIITALMIAMAIIYFPGGEHGAAIFIIQCKRILLFSGFVAWAMLVRRKRPATHKRLMILATIVVLDAAILRLDYILPSFGWDNDLAVASLYQFLLVIPLAWRDWALGKTPDRAITMGAPLLAGFSVIGSALW